MNIFTLDCEATGATNDTKGNPFTESNRLCYVGCLFNNDYWDFNIEYDHRPFGECLERIRDLIRRCDLIVGFNLKYDFHWLRRYGITEFEDKKIWDCQTVEFVLSRQRQRFPSLHDSLVQRGLPGKLDVVRVEYWEKGIDTDNVPEQILCEYLKTDVQGTLQLHLRQVGEVGELSLEAQRLVSLVNQDSLVLEEMESNGIHLDIEGCSRESITLASRISDIYRTLDGFFPDIRLLWTSNDHISAALYGGIVKEKYREVYEWTSKFGVTKIKERWAEREIRLPTLVEPLRGSDLKKAGYFATDEGTLRKLKPDAKAKKIIDLLLEASKLEKLKGTYFDGFPKLYKEMGWTDEILHGQLNQVVVVTGRLSSNAPNQQNLPDKMRQLITSRFP